jgi:urease accessory protein UreF
MADNPNVAERASDRLMDVRQSVDEASEKAVEAGRRFAEAVRAAHSKPILDSIEDFTRKAPLAMIAIAFLAGAMFAAGRRR